MSLRKHLRTGLNSILTRYDLEVAEAKLLYEWQKIQPAVPSHSRLPLPDGAIEYLVQDNPRLKELQGRYSTFNPDVTTPLVWTDSCVKSDDMLYFRGDNAYVWQLRAGNMNEIGYALTAYYTKSIDKLNFLEKLQEDGLFGNHKFSVNDKQMSRDLLDSINEIYFLERHLGISLLPGASVLDVGAGYGRLAHRMLCALPNIAQYLCVDAFPKSSFISEYYLNFRNLGGRGKVVPLYEIEDVLRKTRVDVAVNIHSFSECRLSAIEWWLATLAKYGVKNLMIVPNTHELRTNDGVDFSDAIKRQGYKMIARESKYQDSLVQKYAIYPAIYYLFELQ